MTDEASDVIGRRLDADSDTHGAAYPCRCGVTFDTHDERDNHVEQHRREAFEDAARAYISRFYGDPFLAYYDAIRGSMGGMTPWDDARDTDEGRALTAEAVEAATASWLQASLVAGNREHLEDFAPDGDGDAVTLSRKTAEVALRELQATIDISESEEPDPLQDDIFRARDALKAEVGER